MCSDAAARAALSHGSSSGPVYAAVVAALAERAPAGGELVDVGCGAGHLFAALGSRFQRSIGADVLRYQGFPDSAEFVRVDLDRSRVELPDASADVVTCVEAIEHVENPRALLRELVRLARPGGVILVTTPNQLSLLSKACLVLKNEFVHFQERPGLYPAHITALLEVDLVRMFHENGLVDVEVIYSGSGRVPLVGAHWPRPLAARRGRRGRAFSDNVLVCGRRPAS